MIDVLGSVLENWVAGIGFLAAALTLTTFLVATTVVFRLFAMGANLAFIGYGYFGDLMPPLVLHAILLPINVVRLVQALRSPSRGSTAVQGSLDLDRLKPFAVRTQTRQGDVVFVKGDAADGLFFIVDGRYRLSEIEKDVVAGEVVGELGLFAPEARRSLTFKCIEDGTLLGLSYDRVRKLYAEDPRFGFYLLELVSSRLFADIRRLEAERMRREVAA